MSIWGLSRILPSQSGDWTPRNPVVLTVWLRRGAVVKGQPGGDFSDGSCFVASWFSWSCHGWLQWDLAACIVRFWSCCQLGVSILKVKVNGGGYFFSRRFSSSDGSPGGSLPRWWMAVQGRPSPDCSLATSSCCTAVEWRLCLLPENLHLPTFVSYDFNCKSV